MIVTIIAGSPDIFINESTFDYVIAVDKGIDHALDNNIKFNLAIGDFDSVSHKPILSENIIKLNPIKDETDLFVAVDHAISLKPEKIVIYGATNGRFDHYLANIYLLGKYNIEIIDKINTMYVKERYEKIKNTNGYVSFFNYSGNPVITLKGFKYPLDKYLLNRGDSLCVSNEIIDEYGEIFIENGKVLIIVCNK